VAGKEHPPREGGRGRGGEGDAEDDEVEGGEEGGTRLGWLSGNPCMA